MQLKENGMSSMKRHGEISRTYFVSEKGDCKRIKCCTFCAGRGKKKILYTLLLHYKRKLGEKKKPEIKENGYLQGWGQWQG